MGTTKENRSRSKYPSSNKYPLPHNNPFTSKNPYKHMYIVFISCWGPPTD